MNILNIAQIILSLLIIILVTLQVSKASNGISGLMGASFSKPQNKSRVDKTAKIMITLILFFLALSFYSSYNESKKNRSVVNTEQTISIPNGETNDKNK